MKIEIEAHEFARLNNLIQEKQTEIEQLQKRINDIDEKELRKKAIRLSMNLCDNYLRCIFNALGFDNKQPLYGLRHQSIRIGNDIINKFGEDWYKSQLLDVNIGVNICQEFKNAFIEIGINTDKIKK
jgi:hypothetical protein